MIGPLVVLALIGAVALVWKFRVSIRDYFAGPPVAPVPGTPVPVTRGRSAWGWLREFFWVILLIMAGICVFYFGVYTQSWRSPSPTELGGKGQTSWFWLVILWVIGHALIAFLAKDAVAKWLHKLLAVVMIALIVAFPLYRWATSPPKPPQFEWMSVTIPAKGRTPGLISVPPGHRIVTEGFGQLVNVYPGNPKDVECWARSSSCPATGAVKGAYIVNEGTSPITVRYTFE